MELPQLSVPNKLETFQAPPFPIVKYGQYICTYTLVAPKGTRIRFWFDKFGTETFNSAYFYLWVRFLMCKKILKLNCYNLSQAQSNRPYFVNIHTGKPT